MLKCEFCNEVIDGMYANIDGRKKCWDCINKDFEYEPVIIDGAIRYIEKIKSSQ